MKVKVSITASEQKKQKKDAMMHERVLEVRIFHFNMDVRTRVHSDRVMAPKKLPPWRPLPQHKQSEGPPPPRHEKKQSQN